MTTLDHKPVNPEVDTIRHHYEVSNDFYRLLLGPAMMYSGRRSAADGQPGVQLGGLPRPDRRRMLRQTMGSNPEPSALETNRQLFAATPVRCARTASGPRAGWIGVTACIRSTFPRSYWPAPPTR